MPQNLQTTCAHNAVNQVYVAGRTTRCRKCGCELEPETRAVAQNPTGAPNIAPAGVLAGYPGEVSA